MIPRKIHYCWFGNSELPPLAHKCILSWKRVMPGIEIIRWDESNYDVSKNRYMKEAYEKKKYAFVSDFARLDIIYSEGGIYLDVDVELLRPLDDLLEHENCFLGFQTATQSGKFLVNTGLGFGAEPGNEVVRGLLDDYSEIAFVKPDGSLDLVSCPTRNSSVLEKMGLKTDNCKQTVGPSTIYPSEFFCPMDEQSGRISITENTFSIHHFSASWLTPSGKLKRKIRSILGVEKWERIKKLLKGQNQ